MRRTGGDAVVGLERLEERAPDEELRAEDVVGRRRRSPRASSSRISSIWRG